MKFFLFACSILIQQALFSQNGKSPVKVTDLLKIKSLNAVNLSHDGSKAVFTLTAIEPDGDTKWEYKYVNQIWVVPTNGSSGPKQLTTKESSSQPDWSPDGKQLVFVRVADGKPQLFLLPVDGGEAVQLTKFKYGAASPQWSPDGTRILFSSGISLKELIRDSLLNPDKEIPSWPFEKPGFEKNEQFLPSTAKADPDGSLAEIRSYLENNIVDKKAKVIDKLNFQDETDLSPDIALNHYFIIDAKADARPVELTKGFYNFNHAEFTPDSREVIITGDRDSLQHPDRFFTNEIFSVDVNGNNFHLLLGQPGREYSSAKLSHSGKWLAIQYRPVPGLALSTLAILPLNGNSKDIIDLPFDRAKGNLIWSKDDSYIYFTAQSNGGAPIYRVNIKTKQVEPLTDFNSGVISFDIVNDKLVYVKTEVADPFEIYLSDLSAKKSKRISSFNADWVQSRTISLPVKKTFINNKGQEIEYWIMKPANYQEGKKFPLLLNIHGGPTAMWGPGETGMWHEFQFWCGKGYGLVYCNPRGSGGYGVDFMLSNVNDWGSGPASDVLTAVDKTVAEGWVDTSRLVVTGGSYAGYLVAWILAHDHRFKAACSQRGVYDLATFYGEGNAWRLVPLYFGGYPWEQATRATLERESPINYVDRIKTPYIIFHGDNDRRTGFVQSEMLYRSLKTLGRPVEYVRHPGGTHELTRSGNNRQRIDQMLRTYEFFERWLDKK